jgi:hypothetical protein
MRGYAALGSCRRAPERRLHSETGALLFDAAVRANGNCCNALRVPRFRAALVQWPHERGSNHDDGSFSIESSRPGWPFRSAAISSFQRNQRPAAGCQPDDVGAAISLLQHLRSVSLVIDMAGHRYWQCQLVRRPPYLWKTGRCDGGIKCHALTWRVGRPNRTGASEYAAHWAPAGPCRPYILGRVAS